MRTVLAACLFCGLLSLSPARADEIGAAVEALLPEIVFVRTGGEWEDGEASGRYRLVISLMDQETGQARLFIQWLAEPQDGSLALVDSQEVAGVAEANLRLLDFTFEADEQTSLLILEAEEIETGVQNTYEVQLGPPGEVEFRPATN
jgi:hypothetical protein